MSAPERIWLFSNDLKRFAPGGGMISMGDTEYIRADLPPTLSACLAHPEVKALVEALNQYQLAAAGFVSVHSARDKADAALARIKDAAI